MSLMASIHVCNVGGQHTAHIAIAGKFEATVPISPSAAQRIAEEIRAIAMRCRQPDYETNLPEFEQG
jgi:hypothetical protein